jgi:hypothetical protein
VTVEIVIKKQQNWEVVQFSVLCLVTTFSYHIWKKKTIIQQMKGWKEKKSNWPNFACASRNRDQKATKLGGCPILFPLHKRVKKVTALIKKIKGK